jgi:hypothetical protein
MKKLVADLPRLRYEQLRTAFFEGGDWERNGYWESFRLFGIYGLFQNNHHNSYVVEVSQAPRLRWCGTTDPGSLVLREVFIQLISNEYSIRSHL